MCTQKKVTALAQRAVYNTSNLSDSKLEMSVYSLFNISCYQKKKKYTNRMCKLNFLIMEAIVLCCFLAENNDNSFQGDSRAQNVKFPGLYSYEHVVGLVCI